MSLKVDPAFEQAGWDFDNFVIETGGQENRPGGLGGTTGTTPNEPFTITIRQDIWDTVPFSSTLRANHDLRLVIDDGSSEPYTTTLPVSEFRKVTDGVAGSDANTNGVLSPLGGWSYDLFYVQHGFGHTDPNLYRAQKIPSTLSLFFSRFLERYFVFFVSAAFGSSWC